MPKDYAPKVKGKRKKGPPTKKKRLAQMKKLAHLKRTGQLEE